MTTDRADRARAELEQHTLLYADHQLIKTGDFETVATRLTRRSRFRLIVAAVAAVFAFAVTGGDAMWPIVFVFSGIVDYLATRSTLTAVRKLHGVETPAGDESG